MEYRYISGDTHLEIDSKHWIHRVDPKYRDRAPRVVRLANGGDAWMVEGQPLRENSADIYGGLGRDGWKPYGQTYETTPGTGTPEQRLEELDRDGLDAEVIYPAQAAGPGLWRSIKDDDAYKSVIRGYNDFLLEEYCAVNPQRLLGLPVLPWTGVDDAVTEMEHVARRGAVGVVLGVFPSGKSYPIPEDDRFWAAALDMNMPVTVHVELRRTGDRITDLFQYPEASMEVMENMRTARDLVGQCAKFARAGGTSVIQLVLSGIFDRFPDLKVYFAENQIGWVPFFMEMADVRYQRHIHWAEELLGFKPLARPPSEYIREHIWWGFQYDPVGVELRHHMGVDHLIWGSDFPHQESDWPNSLEITEQSFATVKGAEDKYKMMAGNAIKYFHLGQA